VNNFRLSDVAMERWGANERPPADVVEDELKRSDLFVGIFAWRYGSLVNGKRVDGRDVSYIEYEYRLARHFVKPRLIFLADEEGEWPVKYIDEDARPIWNFRRGIQGEVTCKEFKDLDE